MPNPSAPAPSTRSTRSSVLRNGGFVVALALGAVGIWLIVAGGTTQRVEIGVLTGLWGLLLGAICGRRLVLAESPSVPELPSQAGHPLPEAVREQTAIAVREVVEIERAEVAAARRAFEAELAQLLRNEVRAELGAAVSREVDAAVTREIGQLRAEIAQLRQELLEKVGGQLRLERIETTRLIGSDLEAMRAEFRRLKEAEESAVLGRSENTVIDAAPNPAPIPAPRPATVVEPAVEQAAAPAVEPSAPAPEGGDPFATLPRLTPFVDDAPDAPPDPTGESESEPAGESGYSGRRRRPDHSEGNDVLTQLIARERVHR